MRLLPIFALALLLVPSVARADEETRPPKSSTAALWIGGTVAASGAVVFTYGALRWLVGAIAPDSAHSFDLVGDHCDTGSSEEMSACERQRASDDASAKRSNLRDRKVGATAMGIGAGIAVFGCVLALIGGQKPTEPKAHVRVLPLETPVRFVPPPSGGGTTVVVPAIGGSF